MELILFEPRLRSSGSHYLNYVLDIANAARKHGLKTKVFSDSAIEPAAKRDIESCRIDVFPVFPSTLISCIRVRAVIWPLMAFAYAWALVKYARRTPGDHIICTVSGTLEYLSGISLVCLAGLFRRDIIVQMYTWETREHTAAMPRLIRLYRRLTEKLVVKAIDSGHLLLRGQGYDVAKHIAEQINREVPSLPYAIDWSKFETNSSKNDPLRIGFLGVMRTEKGFRQFVEAVENYRAAVEVIVQAQIPAALGEPGVAELLERLKRNHRCQVLEGELNIREYRELFSKIDIVVLPYRPADFFCKTSNIFSESIGLGKVVVAPRATLMGKMLSDMELGVAYTPYTSSALQHGINAAVSDFESFHQRAKKKADVWRGKHSADSFIAHILA